MRMFVLIAVLFALALALPASGSIPTQPLPVEPTQPLPGGEKGYFYIQSVPSGGDVYFDAQFYGETPVTIAVSTTGTPTHTIDITLPGYETWTTTTPSNPGAGQTITITATLTPSQQVGDIYVTSSPSGATVTLDRSRSATTPYTFTNIPVGSHEVSVYLSGYQTFYTSVNVNKGQTTSVSAVLSPIVTTGTLRAESNPSGAAVYVDNIYRGVTSTLVGNLNPGSHSVKLSKAGYQDWIGTVSISAGATTYLGPTLTVEPQPKYATVSISSNPPGANVYANGVYIGQTSAMHALVYTDVIPGTYTLLLSKAGYQDYTATQTVVAGKNYDLVISLAGVPNPTTGSISISSSPSGAEVYLDNAFAGGLTPMTIDNLAPGTHTLLLKLPGYNDWTWSGTVIAGSTTQVSASLTPTTQPTPTGILPVTILAALGILFLAMRRR